MAEQHISDLVTGKQRDIIVRGLQALWRERTQAWNLACDLELNKDKVISRVEFGIPEVVEELRKWGAEPQNY